MPTSVRIFVQACRQWSANADSRQGAALAYYTLFSIAPLIVIAVSIAAYVFGDRAARGYVEDQVSGIVGEDVAKSIQKLVEYAAKPRTGTFAPLIGVGLLVFGAIGMFLQVRGALTSIWKLEKFQAGSWLGLLIDYGLALLMVVFSGILLVASLAANILVLIFQRTLNDWMPGLPWHWLELGASFLYLTILFAAMYRILSGGRIPLRYVLYGSFIAAVLFTLGKTLLGWYFVYASPVSAYGAAGSLVAFLIWVYYSAQILFFGAELIQARRTRKEWMNPPLAA